MHLFLQFAKQSLQLCSVTVLLLILTFPLQGMAQTVFTGNGEGTTEKPYEITTEAQLKEIANGRDKHYILMDDIPLRDEWKPIDSFAGSLNGNGFKITNLTIVDDDAGLFKTNGGTISNLGVEVASIKGKNRAGTIAARNDGEISNCFVTGGTISIAERGTVGGIAGFNVKTISNCYVALKRVQITVPTPDGYPISLGGIAGNMGGADASVKYCLVANEEMSVEGATGPKYANNIVGGERQEWEFSDNNKLNFFSYKVLRTGLFQNMANPLDPRGMTGQLWLGSFPTGDSCKWVKNDAGRFCLKTPGGKEMVAINPSDHLYLDGEGTTDSPYLIKNEADLIKLRDYVNKGGNSEVGFCYKLANDITMSDVRFLPIGKYREGYNVGFCGIFEGGGHCIKNLKLDNTGISEVGLFASIGWSAEIRNLAVTNCSITITHRGGGGLLLAPIVGDAMNAWEATIENCYTTGTIDVTSDASDPLAGSVSVGGIAGACNCAITNCYSEVNITVDVQGGSGISGIGGITGLTRVDGRVTNCLAKGSIEAKAEAGGELRCGGIVGEYETNPTQTCLALNPSIKATTPTRSYVSQIALKNNGQAFDPTTVNYASQKMKLFKNDTRYMPVPDTEEAGVGNGVENGVGVFVEVDGSPWKGECPSDDAWETTDGYVNLKSIAETFGLTQQVKVSEHLPLTITIPKIANGTLTSDSTKAFFGDKVTLTITPDPGCKLIESSLKYNDTLIVAVNDVYSFIMPSEAVTLSATFVPDTLRLKDISGDSLLISQKADLSWWYEVKTTEAATKALRQGDGKTLFNGIITGTLADGKALVMGATCQSEITFTDVTVPTLIIEKGAAVVLSSASKLTYTEAQNKGGSLVAKKGATITDGTTGETLKTSAVTITAPTNGTLIVKVGNAELASDDQVTEGSRFTVTATPAPGYETVSVQVMQGTTELTATDGVYTMPGEAITVSATFEVGTLNLGDIPATGNSVLISQKAEDKTWWYEVKAVDTGTKALRLADGKTPFNGIITGTLAAGKALVMGATCQSEITFNGVTVPTLIIEKAAAVVLSSASKLTYTTAQNNGGSLVAKNGADIKDGTSTTIKTSAVTFTAPTNGTFTVQVGTTPLASGDQVIEGSRFTVTATPAPGYETVSVKVMQGTTELTATDGAYTMPGAAITVSATFEVSALNLGDIPATGNSVLISQKAEDKTWWYEVKTTEAGTKALRLADGKTPFNGIITGTLAAGKALVMGATCQSEITFNGVTVSTLIIEEGAAIVLSSASRLTYTTAQNNGGSLVAKNGATLTDGADGTIKTRAVTITAPTNGIFTVQVGTTLLASGDMVTEGSRFTVTATPAPDYETVSVKVMQGTTELTATDGVYTMPGEAITVSATFRRIEVTPPTGYYIVTLPAITGAATNPIAGSYEVEEGGNFSFGLILDADYNQSVPLVEVNGIALTPGDSDGKYLVENIQDNSTVSITGIVKNTPTDNVKVESANRIYALNGILYIQTSQPVEAYIVSLGGQLLRSLHLPAGETKVGGLSRGLYIVRLSNGTSQKVKL